MARMWGSPKSYLTSLKHNLLDRITRKSKLLTVIDSYSVSRPVRILKVVKRTAKTGVFSFCVLNTMISFVGYPAYITGKSMQPEFNAPAENKERENAISSWKNIFFRLDLDWIWVSCWRARNFGFDRGDIVVYVSPKEPYDYVIKRVVGLEGDIVTNEKRQIKVEIPPGHCWVEGDNKSNSVDSNYYGPISKGLIFGVASHVIWPSHKWRKLETGLTPSLLSRVELSEQSPKPRSWWQHFKIMFYFLQTGTRGTG